MTTGDAKRSGMGVTRRGFVATGLAAGAVATAGRTLQTVGAQTPMPVRDRITVDLDGSIEVFDPALTYNARGWSIIHSIYDALVDFGSDGTVVPLAAESFSTEDAVTWDVTLRRGMTFHDGSPVTTAAITRSIAHMRASDSQVGDLIQVVDRVEEIDGLNARIVCTQPAAWLPSQLAVWQVLLPEGFTAESLQSAPVGSGPWRWGEFEAGSRVMLVRNPNYTWGSPKGEALAEEVVYRFVPEPATRVADLTTGQADLIVRMAPEQAPAIEDAGGTEIEADVLATAFVRIAADVEPFSDVRVRRALNHAVDVQPIATALEGARANRLAAFAPDERALGFDSDLAPFTHDPELARSLLAEAGYADGFSTTLEISAAARVQFAEAIAADLEAVGVDVEIVVAEGGNFNAGWGDPDAPPLRYASWRPMYDPNTFLQLVISSEGFLSRFASGEVDALIVAAGAEADVDTRAALYRDLSRVLHDEAPAIFLWNAVTRYGASPELEGWTPRGDDYVLLTEGQVE